MSRLFFIAILVFFHPAYTSGQQGRYDCGAAGFGVAGASVAQTNEWSAFHNIAGVSASEHPTLAFSYIHRYNLRPLQTMAAAVVVPVGRAAAITSGVFRFGDRLFNEQKISFGFANKIGFVRLGAQAHYTQINVESVGREGIFLLDLGGVIELGPTFSVGGHVFNASASGYNRFDAGRFPVILSAGLSYRPVKGIDICFEVEKELDIPTNTKLGVEYIVYERIPVRAGFNLEPSALFFGIGFRSSRIAVDYAFSHHHLLGYTHQGSCALFLKR
jgi:hypothetical protein